MEDLSPKKKLYFFTNEPGKNRGSGSVYMRLNQTHEVLYKNSLLKNVKMRFTTSVKGIHDCYILFCKNNHKLNESMLAEAKQNNNTIIFDILDYYDVKTSLTPDIVKNGFVKHIDIFLVNNEYMKREYEEKFKKPTFVVYHHYDIRLTDIKLKKNEKLKFIFNGYIGDKERNCLYIKEMRKDYGLIVNEFFLDFYNKLLASNYCFVSIRKEGSWEYNNRPLMKLAHAAACDSNIIITNDMSVRDLLDPSYPYLLKDHKYETVCEMIEYVKKTYNTEVWFQGLDIMKGLKEKLKIENVVRDYWVPMFNKVFQR